MHPTGLVDILAGAMLVTSTYGAARLVAARLWRRTMHQDVNIAHMADGVAMAGMLVAPFKTLPNDAWEIVFGAMTMWFASRAVRLVIVHGVRGLDDDHIHHVTHHLSHLVMSGGMLYMFLESAPSAKGVATRLGVMSGMGSPGTGASSLELLALLFVLVLFASAIWHADSLTRFTTASRVTVATPVVVGSALSASSGSDDQPNDTDPSTERRTTADSSQSEQARWLAPRLEMACHIAVCITMGYMLVLLL